MRKAVLCLFLLVMAAGCSLAEEPGDRQQAQQQAAQNRNARREAVPFTLAEPLPGQKDNPVFSPAGHGEKIAGINEVLNVLIDSLQMNDLKSAATCLHGLDEEGGVISLEELQREVELLHPVAWRVVECRCLPRGNYLVVVAYTLPSGAVRRAGPFNMSNSGGLWTAHYNSFAASFHVMASSVLKKRAEKQEKKNMHGG